VRHGDEPIDQDAVARRAGTVLSDAPQASLPSGETGRRDYRLEFPVTEDETTSGTSAEGVAGALDELADGAVVALPFTGAWSAEVVVGVLEALLDLDAAVTVIANVYTGDLWDSSAGPVQLLAHLGDGATEGPPARWHVGHFVGLVGLVTGERGTLVM